MLSFGAINMAMMALMKTLDLLGRERHVVHRERSRRQYGGAEYLLAKLVAELPLDASFAAAFGLALKWRCGLRAAAPALVGLLSLSAACCAALGLAVGALVPGQDAALALGLPVMLVYMVLGVINPAGAQGREQSPLVRAVARASPLKCATPRAPAPRPCPALAPDPDPCPCSAQPPCPAAGPACHVLAVAGAGHLVEATSERPPPR